MEPNKSDWKKFRNSLDKWRERYLQRKNNEIQAILENKNLNETEKYWNIVEFQKKESNKLHDCLDGFTKSNMTLYMAFMRRYEMIDRDDMKEFSE